MFNVQILTTVPQCDEAIAYADEEIDDLQFRQTSAARQQSRTADHTAGVAEDLQLAQADFDAFTTTDAALSEGPAKAANRKRLRKAKFDKENLEDAKGKNNPLAVLRSSADVQALAAQVVVYQTLKTEVTAHKATLTL